MFLLLLLLSEGCVSPFSLGLFVSLLNVFSLCESSFFHHAVLFSVHERFSGKDLETCRRHFLCSFLCCFCGGAIGRCVFISVVAQSSFLEDGFLAWFGPFESLLWSLFFPFPFASCLMLHTLSSFSASSFNTDFFAFSVRGQRRGNWESFSQIFVVIVCVPSSLSHGKFTRIQKGMHS